MRKFQEETDTGRRNRKTITILLIPSHIGIHGGVMADRLAKEAGLGLRGVGVRGRSMGC